MTCGSLAGMAAQTLIHPLDIIRRRAQVGVAAQTATTGASLGMSWTAGLAPALAKVGPAVAVSVVVRDACLGRLG